MKGGSWAGISSVCGSSFLARDLGTVKMSSVKKRECFSQMLQVQGCEIHLPGACLFPCFAVTLTTMPKSSHRRKLWFLQALKGLSLPGG